MSPPPFQEASRSLPALIEALPEPSLLCLADGTLLAANANAVKLLGCDAASITGTPLRRFIGERHIDEIEAALERLAEGGDVRDLSIVLVTEDGRSRHVRCSAGAMRDEDGRHLGAVIGLVDEEDRYRGDHLGSAQREALTRALAGDPIAACMRPLLACLEELAPGHLCMLHEIEASGRRLGTGCGVGVAPALMSAFEGLPISPDGEPPVRAAFEQRPVVCRDVADDPAWGPRRDTALQQGIRSCWSTPVTDRDGRAVAVLTTCAPRPGAPDPSLVSATTRLADTAGLVVCRHRADASLRSRVVTLEGLVELGRLIAETTERSRIVAAALETTRELTGAATVAYFVARLQGGEQLFESVASASQNGDGDVTPPTPGQPPLAWKGSEPAVAVRTDDLETDPRFLTPPGVVEAGTRSVLAMPVHSRAKHLLGVLVAAHRDVGAFSRDHEQVISVIARKVAAGVESAQSHERAQRRVRALGAANERKDDFLALLGHELRNPLGAITTSLAWLSGRSAAEPETRGAVRVLERQTRRMRRIVDDLLDLGRLANGRLAIERRPTLLQECLRGAVESVEDAVASNDQRLEVDLPDEPLVVDGDPVRLEQVFINLLSNASRYSPADTTIRLEARERGPALEVTVRDEGQGIDADMLEVIFDAYAQGPEDAPSGDVGLGLGLALVRELVRLHDGEVRATSPGRGQGSTFAVTLPRSEEALAELPPRGAARGAAHGEGRSLRILIAEDDTDAAVSMLMLLSQHGHRVAHARDGAAALRAAEETWPDVALLDIGLPGKDGWEIAHDLRQRAEGRKLHLVALTGLGQPEDIERSKRAGFDDHLIKPAAPEDLLGLLAEIAERHTVSA